MNPPIEVELVLRSATGELLRVVLSLQAGSQIADAIEQAARLPELAGIPLPLGEFGIYGLRCEADTELKHGDRIERYETLLIDPKDARRTRAKGQR